MQTKTIERARARVVEQHIAIVAKGTIKRTGQLFFLVRGSAGTQYTVLVTPTQLVCSCPAHGVCKHRVLVHDQMAAEVAQDREAKHQAARAAALARANRPFSLFK